MHRPNHGQKTLDAKQVLAGDLGVYSSRRGGGYPCRIAPFFPTVFKLTQLTGKRS